MVGQQTLEQVTQGANVRCLCHILCLTQPPCNVPAKAGVYTDAEGQSEGRYPMGYLAVRVERGCVLPKQLGFEIGGHQVDNHRASLRDMGAIRQGEWFAGRAPGDRAGRMQAETLVNAPLQECIVGR